MTSAADFAIPQHLNQAERAIMLAAQASNAKGDHASRRLMAAALAKINKNVSTHVARRTFGTQMATRVKSPVLQKLMQHSRPDMTAIYIRLGNGEIETELEKIKWEKAVK